MTWRTAITACLLLAACRDRHSAVDARGLVLEGDWRIELHDAASPAADATTGRVALVAVRDAAGILGQRNRLLAAGAVSLFTGDMAERLVDGSRAEARVANADSVALTFTNGRGTIVVVLTGLVGTDTISGVWHSDLTRSAGRAGHFRMMRVR